MRLKEKVLGGCRSWPGRLTISPASGEDSGGAAQRESACRMPFVAGSPNDLAGKRRGFGRSGSKRKCLAGAVRGPGRLTISPASGEDSGGAAQRESACRMPFVAASPNDLAGKRRGFGRCGSKRKCLAGAVRGRVA